MMDFKPGDKVKIRAWHSIYSEIVTIISSLDTGNSNSWDMLCVESNNGLEDVKIVKNWHIISADQNYTEEDIKQAVFLLAGQNASDIVCPYCGCSRKPDIDDYEDCDEKECDKCGKVFSCVVENNPTFTTSRKD